MKTAQKTKSFVFWFLLPLVASMVIFQLYPIGLNLVYSMLNWNGISATASFVGLENYTELVQDPLFWNAVKNSLLYALLGTSLQLAVSFVLAYFVEYGPIKRKGFFRAVFIMPIVATSAAVGMIFKSLFSYDGLVNTLLNTAGIASISWLSTPFWAFVVILIVSVWKEMGTLFIYWMAGFKTVPAEVIEAAKVDGLSDTGMLFKIFLPIMKPVVVMTSLMTFINALKVFDLVQTLTGGGPYFSTDVLSTFIYSNAFTSSLGAPRLSYAASAACMIVLVPMALYGVFVLVKKAHERGAV